jgi:hypothetical protein
MKMSQTTRTHPGRGSRLSRVTDFEMGSERSLNERAGRSIPSNAKKNRPEDGPSLFALVGVTGFEPAASSSRTKRATKLRHTPIGPWAYIRIHVASLRSEPRTSLTCPGTGQAGCPGARGCGRPEADRGCAQRAEVREPVPASAGWPRVDKRNAPEHRWMCRDRPIHSDTPTAERASKG